jgi:shikimate kinase
MKTNVVLIGMPGAGKSTVGVLLAKRLSLSFLDTDVLIQAREGRALQEIVDADGYLELRRVEERILLATDCSGHVIATGGSAVYSPAAMRHLKSAGVAVFLDAPLAELRRRLCDYETRGLAKRPDQTFEDLFADRLRLYRRYADVTVHCKHTTHEAVVESIRSGLDGIGFAAARPPAA